MNIVNPGPYALSAKVDVPDITTLGLTTDNCLIVYETQGQYRSWVPGRSFNPFTSLTKDGGYIVIVKGAIDLSQFFYPDNGGAAEPILSISNISGEDITLTDQNGDIPQLLAAANPLTGGNGSVSFTKSALDMAEITDILFTTTVNVHGYQRYFEIDRSGVLREASLSIDNSTDTDINCDLTNGDINYFITPATQSEFRGLVLLDVASNNPGSLAPEAFDVNGNDLGPLQTFPKNVAQENSGFGGNIDHFTVLVPAGCALILSTFDYNNFQNITSSVTTAGNTLTLPLSAITTDQMTYLTLVNA